MPNLTVFGQKQEIAPQGRAEFYTDMCIELR